ncbi:MAG TPA: amidohydrolase family protein [Myxococcota bacterium]|nr:amidohydrolase family protein [Myxococcota bacterium]
MHRLFRGALLVTCDESMDTAVADLRVRNGLIAEIGQLEPGDAEIVDLSGRWLAPGFVQTHVHLVQSLFRGLCDDLSLMDWLRTRIWPLEGAHDEESTYWAARLGVSELLLGGTTAILDMASVRHTDAVFRACQEAGIRAAVGRALMDRPNEAGLSESREAGLRGACDEADTWHGKGRLRYAFAPRFVPSCTDGLLRECAAEARRRGCLIHTHASENEAEVQLVRELTGCDNIVHLHEHGLTGPDVCLAHCIHLTDHEEAILAGTRTRVLHCPSSNLKLGSGVARIPELMARGIHVSLGADGAPCNNRMEIFTEMRLAALIQKPRLGATAMPASTALALATRNGAEALGLKGGMLEVGRPADLVVLDPNRAGVLPALEPASAIVYAMSSASVESVWIDGEPVVRDGRVGPWDPEETRRGVLAAAERVRLRVGL